MNHNDVLRSLRYMLKVNDAKMAEIIALSGLEVNPVVLATYLKKEDEAGFVRCPERVMAHFLDGLVIHRRGKDDSRTPQPVELPVTNNTILKNCGWPRAQGRRPSRDPQDGQFPGVQA